MASAAASITGSDWPTRTGSVGAALDTVFASGIYRQFAKALRGYEHAQARQLFRRFLDTTARVVIADDAVTVTLPRRAHNPILLDAGLIGPATKIPWWGGRKLKLAIA